MANLKPPLIRTNPALLIAGFSRRYTPEVIDRISEQWRDFAPYSAKIPSRTGIPMYGVVTSLPTVPDGIGYLSGIAVSDLILVPSRFDRLRIPAQTYAKFSHPGDTSSIRATAHSIWHDWLPSSAYRASGGGVLFIECYGEDFDSQTGRGDIEIWLPVKPKVSKG